MRSNTNCTTNPDGVAVLLACGWKLAEGKFALAKTECLCYCTVCPVALQLASALFQDSWGECESMCSIYVCVCVCIQRVLIKRTRKAVGCVCNTWRNGTHMVRRGVCVCLHILTFVCTSVIKKLYVVFVFHCQMKPQKRKKHNSLIGNNSACTCTCVCECVCMHVFNLYSI